MMTAQTLRQGDAASLLQAPGEGDGGTMTTWEVRQGDCREELLMLPNASVSLIVADPPYGLRKGFSGDHNPAEALALVAAILPELPRVLKPNGSLYLFAGPQVAARVEVAVGEWLHVLQQIVWNKAGGDYPPGDGRAQFFRAVERTALRQFLNSSERIIFAERLGAAATLRELREKAGLSAKELCGLIGAHGEVNHGGAVSNWEAGYNVPTEEQYQALLRVLPALPPRDDFIRPFSIAADVPYTDVWNFATVSAYPGKHPCEKPQALLEHIIRTSSRPGDTVLDCFMGGGSTGEAALRLGRKFIGIEIDPHWCEVAERRLASQAGQEGDR